MNGNYLRNTKSRSSKLKPTKRREIKRLGIYTAS
jgi:hypothetical protein